MIKLIQILIWKSLYHQNIPNPVIAHAIGLSKTLSTTHHILFNTFLFRFNRSFLFIVFHPLIIFVNHFVMILHMISTQFIIWVWAVSNIPRNIVKSSSRVLIQFFNHIIYSHFSPVRLTILT